MDTWNDILHIDVWTPVAKSFGYYLLVAMAILTLTTLVHVVTQRYAVKLFSYAVGRLSRKWSSILLRGHLLPRVGLLCPGLAIYILFSLFFKQLPVTMYMMRVVEIYLIIVTILIIYELLDTIYLIYQTFEVAKEKPIKGLLQIFKLILFGLGSIIVIAKIMGQSPSLLLGSLGALTAVVMLIFKDPLLGFVGGFQLAANQMVRVGDWIEMPKHDANGDVIDISLTSVKVRNFDKTITSVPTYALTTESFKNWRGMFDSGGRRIKRAILIDQQTIRFCDEKMYERFRKHPFLQNYLASRSFEQTTNLGLFRVYIETYLQHHDRIHKEGMTFLVRHLEPTENGLPLEIYVFTKDTTWSVYEEIQSEIFEHIIAMIAAFNLRIFQLSFENKEEISLPSL